VTKHTVFLISGGDNEQRDCQMLRENPDAPHALPSNFKAADRNQITYHQHRKGIFVFRISLFGGSKGIK